MNDFPDKMPWGKYRDVGLWAINSGYLKWVIDQDWFLKDARNELLCCAIEKEIELRDLDNSHFYKDKATV